MAANKNIAILGCGWLGLPLAKSLIEKGCRVKGSTTTREKLLALSEAGIEPYLLRLGFAESAGELREFLEGTDVLYINIPPRLRSVSDVEYDAILDSIITEVLYAGIRKVILISSTGIYPDTLGFPIYLENSKTFSVSNSTDRLLKAEAVREHLLSFEAKTAIVRFGGLIGPGRHPVYHLAGKEGIANPEAPVNLIDQKDCIGIIEAIIHQEAYGEIFNAVYPYHPSRKEYYSGKARELGLPLPLFAEGPSVGKTIESKKLESELGYEFQVRP